MRALRSAGFAEDHRTGSHLIMVGGEEGRRRRVSVPIHAERPLRPGTLRRIVGQAGLSRAEFERLLG